MTAVAIVGGGFGGIAAAVRLLGSGTAASDITIFESSDGPGGTWWVNRYPGCAVDTHIHAYEFTFATRDWSSSHPPQAELAAYARDIVESHGFADRFVYDTTVTEAVWDDRAQSWTLRAGERELGTFDVVVSAVGLLDRPQLPDWAAASPVPVVHSSRWEPGTSVRGRTVAVVGTGSTSAQLVPALAREAGRVIVYQRQPGWVEPRDDRDFTPAEQSRYRRRWRRLLSRARIFWRFRGRSKGFRADSRRQRRQRAAGLDYIGRTLSDPALVAAVTPDYPWGCKRPVITSAFYPALAQPHVELVAAAVEGVDERGVHAADGSVHAVDLLVLATGYRASGFLEHLRVVGPEGELSEAWSTRPVAFLGITVPGFPNLFVMYGPNTNGSPTMTAYLDVQARMIARSVARLRRRPGIALDTRADAERRWTAFVDRNIARRISATASGCTNYYSRGGVNVTQWPLTWEWYAAAAAVLPRYALVERRPAG
ncbi:MAG: NAD(P)/FAD-dependent oxidoreductase [Protaetiibacter sp.]